VVVVVAIVMDIVNAIVVVIVVAAIIVVIVAAAIVAIATMVMVIVSSLHRGHGQTMVGVATSLLARSLKECGELRREVINENKKILACTLVHAWLRDSAMLSSHRGYYCC